MQVLADCGSHNVVRNNPGILLCCAGAGRAKGLSLLEFHWLECFGGTFTGLGVASGLQTVKRAYNGGVWPSGGKSNTGPLAIGEDPSSG